MNGYLSSDDCCNLRVYPKVSASTIFLGGTLEIKGFLNSLDASMDCASTIVTPSSGHVITSSKPNEKVRLIQALQTGEKVQ